MKEAKLNKKISNVSRDAFVRALENYVNIPRSEAKKLARMYLRFNVNSTEETLREVIENLELDENISVQEGGVRKPLDGLNQS